MSIIKMMVDHEYAQRLLEEAARSHRQRLARELAGEDTKGVALLVKPPLEVDPALIW